MSDEAERLARPEQTRLQNSGVTGPAFTEFLSDAIDGVNAILPFIVECQRTE